MYTTSSLDGHTQINVNIINRSREATARDWIRIRHAAAGRQEGSGLGPEHWVVSWGRWSVGRGRANAPSYQPSRQAGTYAAQTYQVSDVCFWAWKWEILTYHTTCCSCTSLDSAKTSHIVLFNQINLSKTNKRSSLLSSCSSFRESQYAGEEHAHHDDSLPSLNGKYTHTHTSAHTWLHGCTLTTTI